MKTPAVCLATNSPETIPVLLDTVADRYGGRTALCSGNVKITFHELNAQANRIAQLLLEMGSELETHVLILGQLSVETLTLMLGVLKAGATCVLNDGAISENSTGHVLKLTPSLVLVESDEPAPLPVDWRSTRIISYAALRHATTDMKPVPVANSVRASQAAFCYVEYHGVTIQHHYATYDRLRALEEALPLPQGSTVLCKTSDLFSGPQLILLWLLRGASIVLVTDEDIDPSYLVKTIHPNQVSVLCMPSQDLPRFCESAAADMLLTESLRYVLADGELPDLHLAYPTLPFELFLVHYLPEVGGPFLVSQWRRKGNKGALSSQGVGVDVYIVDPSMQPLPPGIDGEIFISGDCAARGYWGDAGRTAEYFIPDPFSGAVGKRLLRIDIGARWLADGALELRRSPQRTVWRRNRRVALREIEKTVLEDSSFDDCYVTRRALVHGSYALVCYIATTEPFAGHEVGVRLQRRLPPAMIPDFYVPLARLPLLPSGAVDEQQLTAIEVLHPGLCTEWKQQLERREGPDLFTVVEETFQDSTLPIHLSDLVPFWKTSTLSLQEHCTTANPGNDAPAITALQQTELFAEALVSGGPLIIAAAEPRTLQEAFLRVGSRDNGRGVTYIGANGGAVHHSYAEILGQAKKILGGLNHYGIEAGAKIVLQLDKMQEYIPAFWACILGGIRPVTVAIPAAYHSENPLVRKLVATLRQLEHPLILAGDSICGDLLNVISALQLGDRRAISFRDVRNHAPQQKLPDLGTEELAFFQLTSGSTGVSKVIQEKHESVIAHIHATMQFNGDHADDVTLNWLPMDHVGPLLMCLCKDSYLGREQVQAPTELIVSRPLLWLDLIERYKVAFTWAPNFAYKLVVEALKQGPRRTWDLSSLRFFFNAGEQVTPSVVEEFLDMVGPFGVSPNVMQPAYGMAETCTAIAYLNNFSLDRGIRCFEKTPIGKTLQQATLPGPSTVTLVGVGAPIPGVQLRIVDEKNRVIRKRMIGRLQVRGKVVTPGYFNNPKANAEAFTEDDWFNTGDLGFLWDDDLTITGREKEIIIVNGANYHCHEIEDLVSQIKGVEPTWVASCGISGDDTETLVIFFCPSSELLADQVTTILEIKRKVAADIGITPEQVIPIGKDFFPKTTSGKIQRSQLKEALLSGEYDQLVKQIDLQLANTNTIPDWFYRKVWRRKQIRLLRSNASNARYMVFLKEGGQAAETLLGSLEAAGAICIRVEAGDAYAQLSPLRYRIEPANADDYHRLFGALIQNQVIVDRIVYFWSYESLADTKALQGRSGEAHNVLRLFQALEERQKVLRNIDVYVISSHAQFAGSGDKVDWERASLPGLLKSMSMELPWIRVSCVDIGSGEPDASSRIFQELQHASHDTEVAYRKGYRLVPRLQKTKLQLRETTSLPIKRGGFYLITGGLGAIGSRIAQYLTEQWDCKVLLIGRRELLPKHAENDFDSAEDGIDIYRKLLSQGKQVSYRVAGVNDRNAVTQAIGGAAGHAALDGIFHLAGTFREGKLAEVTDASYETVVLPKVMGTRVMYQALEGRPETILVCFSSLNGFFGGLGLSEYAAASSFVDTFCAVHAERYGPRIYGFSWNFWNDLGMSRTLELRKFAATGQDEGISFTQGLYSLLAGLCGAPGHLFVGVNGSKAHLRRNLEDRAYANLRLSAHCAKEPTRLRPNDLRNINVADPFGTPTICHLVPSLTVPHDAGSRPHSRLSHHAAATTPLERQLVSLWQEVLRVSSVGVHDNFFELGGHSLLAVKMMGRLKEGFGMDFTMHDLFAAKTISQMADRIEGLRAAAQSSVRIADVATSGVERGEI